MLVKMTLLDTTNLSRIHNLNKSIVGFMNDLPELGHSLLVWYENDGDHAYTKTTRVNELDQFLDNRTRLRYWVARTDNSTYRVAEIDVNKLKVLEEF